MMRRSPLNRTTRLKTTSPLKRVASKLGNRKRDTGPNRNTRDLVKDDRAKGRCERCGHRGGQIHHRDPRGMGGTSRPQANLPSNLVFLCPPCHADVESNRLAAAGDGWLVQDGYDPRDFKVRMWHGTYYLKDNGDLVPAATKCKAGCAVFRSDDPCDCGGSET